MAAAGLQGSGKKKPALIAERFATPSDRSLVCRKGRSRKKRKLFRKQIVNPKGKNKPGKRDSVNDPRPNDPVFNPACEQYIKIVSNDEKNPPESDRHQINREGNWEPEDVASLGGGISRGKGARIQMEVAIMCKNPTRKKQLIRKFDTLTQLRGQKQLCGSPPPNGKRRLGGRLEEKLSQEPASSGKALPGPPGSVRRTGPL